MWTALSSKKGVLTEDSLVFEVDDISVLTEKEPNVDKSSSVCSVYF